MPKIYFKAKSCKESGTEIKTYPVIGLESETRNRRANIQLSNRSQVKGLRPYIQTGRRRKLEKFNRKIVQRKN